MRPVRGPGNSPRQPEGTGMTTTIKPASIDYADLIARAVRISVVADIMDLNASCARPARPGR